MKAIRFKLMEAMAYERIVEKFNGENFHTFKVKMQVMFN
jgi:hypothetical protein